MTINTKAPFFSALDPATDCPVECPDPVPIPSPQTAVVVTRVDAVSALVEPRCCTNVE